MPRMLSMSTRRRLLAGAALLLPAMRVPAAAKKKQEKEEEVAPGEDLMREHGVLNRALLVYEAWLLRDGALAQVLGGTADLIRRFIEGYHEKTEEEELFPRFEKAGKLVELTLVLRAQHDAGRRLTSQIRSEEHTSELQSQSNLVCRLLLEKKKNKTNKTKNN